MVNEIMEDPTVIDKIWTPEICINRQDKGLLCGKLLSNLKQILRSIKIDRKVVSKHRPEKGISEEKGN